MQWTFWASSHTCPTDHQSSGLRDNENPSDSLWYFKSSKTQTDKIVSHWSSRENRHQTEDLTLGQYAQGTVQSKKKLFPRGLARLETVLQAA